MTVDKLDCSLQFMKNFGVDLQSGLKFPQLELEISYSKSSLSKLSKLQCSAASATQLIKA